MRVQLLFFAQARERAGSSRATLDLPEGSRVVELLAAVERLHPALAELRPHLAVAVNQRMASDETVIPDGAEVALLPPVSGGAPTRRSRFEVRPASGERWKDVERLFGPRGACAGCWCMWPRLRSAQFKAGAGAGNRRRLRRLVQSGPAPGLVGYFDQEPVAWCALAPRGDYARLENSRTLAPVDDQPVWSVPCFFVARAHRGNGWTARMLKEAARYARAHGARVLEGYPLDVRSGKTADTFAWWGLVGAFEATGFVEVARRSKTRPIMRKLLRRPSRG